LQKKFQCYGLKLVRSINAWELAPKTKRFLMIVGISLFVITLSGCKSLPGKLEIDTPFFDIEYEGDKDA